MAKVKELLVEINADTKGLKKGFDKAEKQTSSFGRSIKRIGGLIAGAFATSRITAFAGEVSNLAGEMEGVRYAFKRIADQHILEDLQHATRGTVSELELMKRTVQASNFGLPVENLAKLFEFASRRAQQTGESVDYLVNSIVLGIGRKSPLILDNLGISAIRLREEFKGLGIESASVLDVAGAVARIANEEMGKMGNTIVTSKDRTAQFTAEWSNAKVEIGGVVNIIKDELQPALTNALSSFTKLVRIRKNILKLQQESNKAEKNLKDKAFENYTWWDKIKLVIFGVDKALQNSVETIDELNDKTSKNDLASTLNKTTEAIKEQKKETQDLTEILGAFAQAEWDAKQNGVDRTEEARKEAAVMEESAKKREQELNERIELVNDHITAQETLGEVIAKTMADSAASAIMFGETWRDVIKKTISAVIAKAVAFMVGRAMEESASKGGIAGIILAPLAGAAAGAAAKGALDAAIPSYATGGIAMGRQLAVVGDNPSGRELILPEEKWAMLGMGRSIRLYGKFIQSGRDMIATIDQTEKYENQIY